MSNGPGRTKHRHRSLRRWSWLLLLTALAGLPATAATGPNARVLRVGVVEGSPPCSINKGGVWQGLAVDLWVRIASREQIPYVLLPQPSTRQLLSATEQGQLDLGVQCINLSPERLQRYRFTLPFQEDGLAVLVAPNQWQTSVSLLLSLLSQGVLQVLGIYLVVMVILAVVVWRVEGYGQRLPAETLERKRTFIQIVQILATGPGSNTIVATSRGNLVVLGAYLVRILAASVLVGVVTVKVVDDLQARNRGNIRQLDDLRGLRVAARPGSVSEQLLRELNSTGKPTITILPLGSIPEALPLLAQGRAQAVVADTLQLRSLLAGPMPVGLNPTLALQDIRPEGQGFVLSPTLNEALVDRINLAISVLKRSGVVSNLRQSSVQAQATP